MCALAERTHWKMSWLSEKGQSQWSDCSHLVRDISIGQKERTLMLNVEKIENRVLLCENTLENNGVPSGSKTLNFSRRTKTCNRVVAKKQE